MTSHLITNVKYFNHVCCIRKCLYFFVITRVDSNGTPIMDDFKNGSDGSEKVSC